MKKIALGLLFVLISVPVFLLTGYAEVKPDMLESAAGVMGMNNVNLIPAFVGYLLIFWGLRSSWPSETVSLTRVIAIGSALLTGGQWLSGIWMPFPLEQSLRILMAWRLLQWCEEQEAWDWGFRANRLRMSWYALTGATAAAVVLGAANWTMGILWSGVALGAGLYYAYTFYRMARMVPKV